MTRKPTRTAVEGPDAARRFEGTMGRLLQISKDELTRREADYQDARRTKKLRMPRPATTK